MKTALNNAKKAICFILIGSILIRVTEFILLPHTTQYIKGYNSTAQHEDFYKMPRNTISTVFLGTSHTLHAYSPCELYKKYGICSYNLGTPKQPIYASYFWLREAYKYHPQTLKNVVFDPSYLTQLEYIKESYKVAFQGMRFSGNKFESAKGQSDTLDVLINNTSDLYNYHNRWKELNRLDFTKYRSTLDLGHIVDNYYAINIKNNSDVLTYWDSTPVTGADKEPNSNDETMYYFYKMVDFCKENNINLVLARLPFYAEISRPTHVFYKKLAEQKNLEYINFNFGECYEAVNLSPATDFNDRSYHLNYYGSMKVTDYIGNYLIKKCNEKDIKGTEKYAFMDEKIKEYDRNTLFLKLDTISDLAEYISVVNQYDNMAIFINVNGGAADALTTEQRNELAQVGLGKLSELQSNERYLSVIENGKVTFENNETDYQNSSTDDQSAKNFGEFSGYINGSVPFSIKCSKVLKSNETDNKFLIINDEKCSMNEKGLNITVYDMFTRTVIDTSVFDFSVSSERIPKNIELAYSQYIESGKDPSKINDSLQVLCNYNLKKNDMETVLKLSAEVGDAEFFKYISAFGSNDYYIFLTVQADAMGALDPASRTELNNMGLRELSSINYQESYIGILNGDKVLFERRNLNKSPIFEEFNDFELKSGGFYSGNISSVIYKGIEYSNNTRGINVVVYNKTSDTVIDSRTFDTNEITPVIDYYFDQTKEYELDKYLERGYDPDELSSDLYSLYLKRLKAEDVEKVSKLKAQIGQGDLFKYLREFYNSPDYVLFLTVQSDASVSLDYAARIKLSEMGLSEFSQIEYLNSYVGVVEGGRVLWEMRHPEALIYQYYEDFVIISGGFFAGRAAAVMRNGINYAANTRGLNIVVYNKTTKEVVDSAVFDIHDFAQMTEY